MKKNNDNKVRCNWCEEVFEERKIQIDADKEEYCPNYHMHGYLMDITEIEYKQYLKK
jgi:hypothetical protein